MLLKIPRQLLRVAPQKLQRLGPISGDMQGDSLVGMLHVETDPAKLFRLELQFHATLFRANDRLGKLANLRLGFRRRMPLFGRRDASCLGLRRGS
ncbi:hypothetical protein AYJ57_07810 [Salipiger sp. CCB-MM3]|nr:hypothetical protein AYJ57_07810 [Salipiger sp. CCB-MM3]